MGKDKDDMYSIARTTARLTVEEARRAAIKRHGPLKGGMARWAHHLSEECSEAVAEMWALNHKHEGCHQHRVNLMAELAQVAQLAETMMVMLYMGIEREEEDTWETKIIVENVNPS